MSVKTKRVATNKSIAVNREEARLSDSRYFYGRVCEVNPQHGDVRYTSNGQCLECRRLINARKSESRSKSRKAIQARMVAGMKKRDPDCFRFVAFSLGSVENIQRWLSTAMVKMQWGNEA